MSDKTVENKNLSHYFSGATTTIFDDLADSTKALDVNLPSPTSGQTSAKDEHFEESGISPIASSILECSDAADEVNKAGTDSNFQGTVSLSNDVQGENFSELKLSQYFSGASTEFDLNVEVGPPASALILPSYSSNPSDGTVNLPPTSSIEDTYDAWIPSKATKEALEAKEAATPGSEEPPFVGMQSPTIAVKEDFSDPVLNLVHNCLGQSVAANQPSLTCASVTQDDRGLRQLIANGYLHAAVNLTTRLLKVYDQGEPAREGGRVAKHTPHSLQLWFTRLALLVRLRRFSLAEVECEPFGALDSPNLFFQYYPELHGGRKGSMAPFSFRLLTGELPQFLGKHTQALDRLANILATCEQILSRLKSGLREDGSGMLSHPNTAEARCSVWQTRKVAVLYAMTRCAVGLKDLRLSFGILQRLLQEDPGESSGVYAAMGRLCLQMGDIKAAQDAFQRHLECAPPGRHSPVQGLVHSAFVAIAENNFREGARILQQAAETDNDNPLILSQLSVCLMFLGQLRPAIRVSEKSIMSKPEKHLHEASVLNLSSMYELESSSANEKKKRLLELVSKHKGDGFNVAAFKMQSSA